MKIRLIVIQVIIFIASLFGAVALGNHLDTNKSLPLGLLVGSSLGILILWSVYFTISLFRPPNWKRLRLRVQHLCYGRVDVYDRTYLAWKDPESNLENALFWIAFPILLNESIQSCSHFIILKNSSEFKVTDQKVGVIPIYVDDLVKVR